MRRYKVAPGGIVQGAHVQLEGWSRVPGSAGRYINPEGENVSRRAHLNAQAHSVGFASYARYQKLASMPLYKQMIAHAQNPTAARKLGSQFNRIWGSEVERRLGSGRGLPKALVKALLDAAGIEYTDEELDEKGGLSALLRR